MGSYILTSSLARGSPRLSRCSISATYLTLHPSPSSRSPCYFSIFASSQKHRGEPSSARSLSVSFQSGASPSASSCGYLAFHSRRTGTCPSRIPHAGDSAAELTWASLCVSSSVMPSQPHVSISSSSSSQSTYTLNPTPPGRPG